MNKICCITGHRPKGFPFTYGSNNEPRYEEYLESLSCYVDNLIRKESFSYFISGCAIGVDMDFAEIVIGLKEYYPNIKLEIAIPCDNQDLKWTQQEKIRYKSILQKADIITNISHEYSIENMYKRNRYMVKKSDLVLAVWNGIEKGGTWYTINYARKITKKIDYIFL